MSAWISSVFQPTTPSRSTCRVTFTKRPTLSTRLCVPMVILEWLCDRAILIWHVLLYARGGSSSLYFLTHSLFTQCGVIAFILFACVNISTSSFFLAFCTDTLALPLFPLFHPFFYETIIITKCLFEPLRRCEKVKCSYTVTRAFRAAPPLSPLTSWSSVIWQLRKLLELSGTFGIEILDHFLYLFKYYWISLLHVLLQNAPFDPAKQWLLAAIVRLKRVVIGRTATSKSWFGRSLWQFPSWLQSRMRHGSNIAFATTTNTPVFSLSLIYTRIHSLNKKSNKRNYKGIPRSRICLSIWHLPSSFWLFSLEHLILSIYIHMQIFKTG